MSNNLILEDKMKKTLLVSLLIAVLICMFAIAVSAEAVIPEWTETQTIPSIAFKEGFDTTSRVLLSNGDGTYTTYPTNYIIDGSDTTFTQSKELNFSVLNKATENKYSYTYASVVRLEIPAGYTSIQERTLRTDKGFTSMVTCKIPEGVLTMGTNNFYSNAVIQEVEFPDSLDAIGTECFRLSSIKKVIIGKNTVVSDMAFYDAESLETVILSEGIKTIGTRAFIRCTSLTSITLPSTLESVGISAFYGSSLTEIVVPENVTSIGKTAFANCASLEKAIVRCSVMGEQMFASDSNMKYLYLSKKITSIGAQALQGANITNFLTIYTGSDPTVLATLYSNDRFNVNKSNHITFEQYLLDAENEVAYTKNTVVYGANECYALYNNVHAYDYPDYCVAKCERCGFVKNPSVSDHNLETVYTYENGFISAGKKLTKCTVEGCTYNVEEETSAIFTLKGYSNKIGGDKMCVGYNVNTQALNDYRIKNTLSYGLVAYVPVENETNISPVTSDLTAKSDKTVLVNVDSDYVAVDFMLTGFSSKFDQLSFVMCAYTFDGEKVEYLCVENGELTQSEYASTITYQYTENN